MQAGELGADVPIAVPKHLMAINLFFLRTPPVGAQCWYPLQMSNRDKKFHLQSQSAPHCFPHGHFSAGLLGRGWCGILPSLGREQASEGG